MNHFQLVGIHTLSTASFSANKTNPKPLDLSVLESFLIVQSLTTPNFVKYSRNLSEENSMINKNFSGKTFLIFIFFQTKN